MNKRRLGRTAVVDVFGGRTPARRVMTFLTAENVFDTEYDIGRIPMRTVGLRRALRAGIQIALP